MNCPGCKKPLHIQAQFVGKDVRCPHCRTVFTAAGTQPEAIQEDDFGDDKCKPRKVADAAREQTERARVGARNASPRSRRDSPRERRSPTGNYSRALFARMPAKARPAATGLLAMSIISLLIPIAVLVILLQSGPRPADPTGRIVAVCLSFYFVLLAAAGITAALLLGKRQPAGRVVAWCVVPFFLVNNLIFIVISVFVIVGLQSSSMRRYLSWKRTPESNEPDYWRGVEAGSAWAQSAASRKELRRLEDCYLDAGREWHVSFPELAGLDYEPWEWLYYGLHPAHEGSRAAARDFWEDVVPGRISREEDWVFVKGFADGALAEARE